MQTQYFSDAESCQLSEAMADQLVDLETAVDPGLCSGILNGKQRAMETDKVTLGRRIEYGWEEAEKTQHFANLVAFVLVFSLASAHLLSRLYSTYQLTLEHFTTAHQVFREARHFAILSTKAKNHRKLWTRSLLHLGIPPCDSIQLAKE